MNSTQLRTIGTVLMLIIVRFSTAQTPVFFKDWDVRFGGNQDDAISWFEKTNDAGLILGGNSFSGISGDKTQPNYDPSLQSSDFWVVKTDSNGVKLWDKRYGGFNTDVLYKVLQTSDGGYLAAGQSYSGISGDKSQPNWDATQQSSDYWIIKTDAAGIKLWDKRFGGNSFDLFGSIKQTQDGGYIMCGSTFSGVSGDITTPTQGSWDYWVVKTDSLGNKLWTRRYGGALDDFATSVDVTASGGAIIAGYSKSYISGDKTQSSQGNWDYWALKIDALGNIIWDKTFGGNNADWLFDLISTSDGGVLFGGQSFSDAVGDKSEPNHDPTPSGSDRWVLKTDGNGNKLWDHSYGGDMIEDLTRLFETTDGGFLISGESYSADNGDKSEPNLGIEQTWVLKVDSIGVYEWDKTIFSLGHDEGGTAIPVSDLCFVAVNYTLADTGGYKTQITQGNGDYWMVKICIEDPTSIQEINANNSNWLLYPNPTAGELYFKNNHPFGEKSVTVELINAAGMSVLKTDYFNYTQGAANKIDISKLENGFYFCRITSKSATDVIRFVKMK